MRREQEQKYQRRAAKHNLGEPRGDTGLFRSAPPGQPKPKQPHDRRENRRRRTSPKCGLCLDLHEMSQYLV